MTAELHAVPALPDDPDAVRAALLARILSCWDRLDDVVSELHELHGVDAEAIVERVLEVAVAEA